MWKTASSDHRVHLYWRWGDGKDGPWKEAPPFCQSTVVLTLRIIFCRTGPTVFLRYAASAILLETPRWRGVWKLRFGGGGRGGGRAAEGERPNR